MIQEYKELVVAFENFKRALEKKDPELFVDWAQGGYTVASNVVKYSPNIHEVMEVIKERDQHESLSS